MKQLLPVLLVLALASLSCNLPVATATPGVPPTGEAPTQPSPAQPPTALPGVTPAPSEPASGRILPAGVAVLRYSPYVQLSLVDLTGAEAAGLAVPSDEQPGPGRVHLAGRMSDGAALPLAFFSYSGGESIKVAVNGQVTQQVPLQSTVALTGVPGGSTLAFTTIEYAQSGTVTRLFVGSIDALPTLAPFLTLTDPGGWTIKPLSIDRVDGQVRGVWFTYFPWGIGGDIMYEPREGLYYFDLTSMQTREIFGRQFSPWDFDPDGALYALTTAPAGGLDLALSPSGPTFNIPLLPDSDRGAGDAFISPDGQVVAWKEASGTLMSETPNLKITLRFASRTGEVLRQVLHTDFSAAAGFPVQWAAPVGWLDSTTLLVQVRGEEWERHSAVCRLDLSGAISLFAPGGFVGFVYP